MAKCEFNRRFLNCQQFSLGPLRWRSVSWQESEESESDNGKLSQDFVESLRVLIDHALAEGCTLQDLNTILRKHTPGDHDGDA
jgi:hypothetical protein